MGHVRGYTLADAHARFRRSRGDAVLFALGFSAFGSSAELSATATDEPTDRVDRRCAQMREQIERLGYSFDWSRTYSTGEPDIYRWSQWLFLALLEDGLIYRRRAQWHLRLSAYNEENDRRVSELTDWDETAIAAQRATLGRVDGVELEAFALDRTQLTVFTPYPDAIADAAFVALSPHHPELSRWVDGADVERRLDGICLETQRNGHSQAKEPAIVETDLLVQIPEGARPLPLLISPSVDARFGATAILGIPARDDADKILAARLKRSTGLSWRLDKGRLATRPAVRYRAADVPISRPRASGTPIPIVYCDRCGTVPVPVEQLPVALPQHLVVSEETDALAARPDFVGCTCPTCGEAARRETDTLDCSMDAAWMEVPLAVPQADRSRTMFNHPELSRWLPASRFIHGADTGSAVLTERTVIKSLRDRGVLDFLPTGEPYGRSLTHGALKLAGHTMSSHLDNPVNPMELIGQFGADTVRFAMLYAATPSKSFNWNEDVLRHCSSFLSGLWQYAEPRLSAGIHPGQQASIELSDRLRLRLASWCRTAITKVTENLETLEMQRATRNLILLLTRIEDFEQRVVAHRSVLAKQDRQAVAVALTLLLQLLAPLAPHIAEELWQQAGFTSALASAPWPAPGPRPRAPVQYG